MCANKYEVWSNILRGESEVCDPIIWKQRRKKNIPNTNNAYSGRPQHHAHDEFKQNIYCWTYRELDSRYLSNMLSGMLLPGYFVFFCDVHAMDK